MIGHTGPGAIIVVVVCLCAGACTTDDIARGIGQTLYNAGRYVCTQSKNCDVRDDDDHGPTAPTNRR
jgi:hypothetical protein